MMESATTAKQKMHRLVDSEEELLRLIRQELNGTDQRELVMMAGHFMLFLDEEENRLRPGIIEEQRSDVMRERIARRVGIFPTYTWELAVKLGKDCAGKFEQIKFLLLINDWQYIPSQGGSAPELRKSFYDSFDEIPETYRATFQESAIFGDANILASRKHPKSFPETWLKYRFQKSAEKLVKMGKLERRILGNASSNDSAISFLDENGNYKPLITCGVTGCAGEITEMISEVYKAGYRLLLMFAPGECHQPVRTGVEIAMSLYNVPGMKIIISDPGGSGEMTQEEIYEKMVNFTVLQS